MSEADSSSLRSRFNPFNWPDRLRQRKERDPSGNGSARDVQDPHVWEDPDPGIRERLTPDTPAQWMVLGAGALTFIGLAVYLYPIFGPAFRNPFALAGFGFLSYSIIIYLKGRQDGIRRYVEMAKSIIYYGDEIDVRLGEEQGEKGKRKLFTPYVDLTYGGFNARELKKRDLPYDADKLRSNTQDSTGELPVVDRLNATTVETDTETFGKVLFTHASDLKHDAAGRYSDRYTPLPNEMDEDVAENVNRLFDDLEHNIRTLERKVQMYEQSNEELRNLKESQTAPQLKETLHLLTTLRGMFATRDRRSSPELDAKSEYDKLEEELAEQ